VKATSERRVVTSAGADLFADAGQVVDDAAREPGFLEHLHELAAITGDCSAAS
jgi:hypothetical protein